MILNCKTLPKIFSTVYFGFVNKKHIVNTFFYYFSVESTPFDKIN